MPISKKAVSRPVTVIVLFSLIIALGLFILPQIPIDLYPEFNPPVLVVSTSYPGAGPEEVESSVTRILEGMLENINDIKEIRSTSSENQSIIILEFEWKKNLSEAADDVRDKLEFIKEYLPDDAKNPSIFKFDPSMMPILDLTVEGNRPPEELMEIAEDIIQPRLEQISGVSLTYISGGRERIIRVEASKNRLQAFNLTLGNISAAIKAQNVQVGGGRVSSGSYNYLIRTDGEFKSIEEIKNTVVAYRGGSSTESPVVIKLSDIAEVKDGFKDDSSIVFINGKTGIYIEVQKKSGENSVQVADRVVKSIDKINNDLPPGITLKVLKDSTDIIRDSIKQVTKSALTGAFLAMTILLVFLRNVKSTFIIGISIPVSLLITLMGMYFFDVSINIISLAGLTLGVGMIVDSSIVILENIYRYREKGSRLKVSAVLGSTEMTGAITASTLTTICVFLPIVLFKSEIGFLGILFGDLAFTVVVALVSSLFVALLLVPVLSGRYLPIYTKRQKPFKRKIYEKTDSAMEAFFSGMEKVYSRILLKVFKYRKTSIISVILLLIVSLFLIPAVGLEFSPSAADDVVSLTVNMPVGTNLETTLSVVQKIESIIRQDISGFRDLTVTAGGSSDFLSGSSSYLGRIKITLPEYKQRIDTSEDIKRKLRTRFDDFPGVVFSFDSGQGRGAGNPNPIDILVKSNDTEAAKKTAEEIKNLISDNVEGAAEPDTDISDGLPQLEIKVDRERAYELGLSLSVIGSEINAAVSGITASKFRIKGDEYDIFLILKEEDRNEIPDLKTLYIQNSRGQFIPVSAFASLVKTTGPLDINRLDQTRVIHVTAGLQQGVKLNKVQNEIDSLIKNQLIIPDSVNVEYSGDVGDLKEYGIKFLAIMVMALFLVYGVMASQFESFKDPFIMFLTVPLLFIGVVFIHLITGSPFSMFTAVGVIMLAGIVVNNGIVLVDYINLLIGRGEKLEDACVKGGVSRLRPILMTTLTTILGMAPMAFIPGEGSELVQPIGQAVIGGLTTSTFITLFFIPAVFAAFNKKRFDVSGESVNDIQL